MRWSYLGACWWRTMSYLRYEAATDGQKIRWPLWSNTQHPYVDCEPKLLSVVVSVCLPSALTLFACMKCLMEPQWSSSFVSWSSAGKETSVWEPHWHIRSSVCLIGLEPSALNPKQNEQAMRWLLLRPPDSMR